MTAKMDMTTTCHHVPVKMTMPCNGKTLLEFQKNKSGNSSTWLIVLQNDGGGHFRDPTEARAAAEARTKERARGNSVSEVRTCRRVEENMDQASAEIQSDETGR